MEEDDTALDAGIAPANEEVEELGISDGGPWALSSASTTRYFLDLSGSPQLLRQPGERSGTGPYDNCWLQLLAITADGESGRVRVGRRHRFDLDPKPRDPSTPLRWWIQRTVSAIRSVPLDERPEGRPPAPDEDWVGYKLRSVRPTRATGSLADPRERPTRDRPGDIGEREAGTVGRLRRPQD